MFKSIGERINEIVRERIEGTEVFDLSFQPDEKEYINELMDEMNINGYFMSFDNIFFLEDHETYVTLKVTDLRAFVNDFYRAYGVFFGKENEEDVFKYPEDVQDVLKKHDYLKPYQNDIVNEKIKKYLAGKRIRGYKTFVEDEGENNFIVKKRFIALYELLFFNKSNKPYVEIKRLNEKATLYIPNSKNYIRKDENTVVCLYKNFERFKDLNDLDFSDFVVSKDSIEKFYGFDDVFFVNPTKKWVEMWWNYDCPNLYRYTPNIRGTSNFFGLVLECWQNQLVESTWNAVYIDEDILEEEVEKFAGDYTHTAIYSQMRRVLDARELSEEEKQAKIRKAEKIEEEIQEIIDKNAKNILLKTAKRYTNSFDEGRELEGYSLEELHNYLSTLERSFCLDCGFLYIALADERLELFKEIAEYDDRRFNTGAMKLKHPFIGQSTTIKREMASHIKEVVEKESNYKIKYWTVLD